jgi:tetratricopeptide (TPR) repeat protein
MPVALRDELPRRLILACAFSLGAALTFATMAGAQDAGSAFKNGEAAYTAGKYDLVVRQLTAAISGANLAPNEAARALYMRGIAYRKLDQTSRAIADLGAAMWLGLPVSDRLSAQVNRGLAYRAAGLNEQGDADIAAAKKANPDQVETLLAQNGARSVVSIPDFSTEVRAEPQPASAPPPTRTADASPDWTTVASGPERGPAPEKPQSPVAAPASGLWDTAVSSERAASQPAPAAGGNRLSRWWESLRSSSQNTTTATDASPAPLAKAASSWSTQTQTGEQVPAPPQKTAVADAAAPAAPASGGYRLQLTATRSEEEAQALWRRVLGEHKRELAGHEPLIEKTDIGNLGTFYRLQIGPFPDKTESLKLCNSLKQSGVDCFLVAR